MPCAKIVGNKTFSIINDYIGRPIQAYDNNGNLVWQTDYDIYGDLKNLKGDRTFISFRQLGQYEDVETGLYYNRFRYYNPETGLYISKDPISILGGLNVYAYVKDTNRFVDVFGLELIEVNPLDINYSQRTVSDIRIFDSLKYEPIRVINEGGQLVSYDNRRLLAAQNAEIKVLTVDLVNKADTHPKLNMTWWEAFQRRYNDIRNIEAGGVVPDKGLKEKPKLVSICKNK